MGYFVDPNARHRISLREYDGSDEWFEIPVDQAESDRLAVQDALLTSHMSVAKGDNSATTETRLQRQFETLLGRTIKGWSFVGPDGNAAPVNARSIASLGPVGRWMADQIDAYYEGRRMTPEQRRDLANGSAPSTAGPVMLRQSASEFLSPNGLESRILTDSA